MTHPHRMSDDQRLARWLIEAKERAKERRAKERDYAPAA